MVNDIENTKMRTDVFVINRFKAAHLIFENLANLGLFNAVYYIDIVSESEKIEAGQKPFLIFKNDNGFSLFVGYSDRNVMCGYNQVFIGDAMPFGLLLCYKNGNANVFAYDDGLPMYKGNFLTDQSGGFYGLVKRVLKIREFSVRPLKYYVNCRDLCHSTVAKEIMQLPKWVKGNKAIEFSERLFMYKKRNAKGNRKIVFLEQPMHEMDGYTGRSISSFIKNLGIEDECIVRLHPRSCQSYDNLVTDTGDNNWELECINVISDGDILMGCYSMSLFSPKIIADKEPYVIFLFDVLLETLNENKRRTMVKTIKEFEGIYRSKDKVLIAASEADLVSILKDLRVVRGNW